MLGVAVADGGAGGVGHEIGDPQPLLGEDELAVADIGDAFRIIEGGALRIARLLREGHHVDELAGLADLRDRGAAVADDEQRVGIPVVGDARGFLREEIVGRRGDLARIGQIVAADQRIAAEVDRGGERGTGLDGKKASGDKSQFLHGLLPQMVRGR